MGSLALGLEHCTLWRGDKQPRLPRPLSVGALRSQHGLRWFGSALSCRRTSGEVKSAIEGCEVPSAHAPCFRTPIECWWGWHVQPTARSCHSHSRAPPCWQELAVRKPLGDRHAESGGAAPVKEWSV